MAGEVTTVFNAVRKFARSLPAKYRNYCLSMATALDRANGGGTVDDLLIVAPANESVVLATYQAGKITKSITLKLTDYVGRIHQWYDGTTLTLTVTPTSTNGVCYTTDDYHAKVTTKTITMDKGTATFNVYFFNKRGYKECGLTGKTGTTETGLAGTTEYTFKIGIDGATATQKSITTASNTTFAGVIALLNAATPGATWSIVSGDLRCTSDTDTTGSAISLAAPDTGTGLFATLTGFSALDAAVARGTWADEDSVALVFTATANKIMGATIASDTFTVTIT